MQSHRTNCHLAFTFSGLCTVRLELSCFHVLQTEVNLFQVNFNILGGETIWTTTHNTAFSHCWCPAMLESKICSVAESEMVPTEVTFDRASNCFFKPVVHGWARLAYLQGFIAHCLLFAHHEMEPEQPTRHAPYFPGLLVFHDDRFSTSEKCLSSLSWFSYHR